MELQAAQARVGKWLVDCFGNSITFDKQERNCRFFEEAVELVQAYQFPKWVALAMVEYIYERDPGDPKKEPGDLLIAFLAHCHVNGNDAQVCLEEALENIQVNIAKIREKNLTKEWSGRTIVTHDPAEHV